MFFEIGEITTTTTTILTMVHQHLRTTKYVTVNKTKRYIHINDHQQYYTV